MRSEAILCRMDRDSLDMLARIEAGNMLLEQLTLSFARATRSGPEFALKSMKAAIDARMSLLDVSDSAEMAELADMMRQQLTATFDRLNTALEPLEWLEPYRKQRRG